MTRGRRRISRAVKIRRNESTSVPQCIIALDTEAFQEEISANYVYHRFAVGAIKFGRRKGRTWIEHDVELCYSPKECAYLILQKAPQCKTLYLFAHNWQYDFMMLNYFKDIQEFGYRIERFIVDSQRFIVTFRAGNSRLKLIDTTNYFKAPLAELARVFGLQKVEIEDWWSVDIKTLEARVRQDVIILFNIVKHLIGWWLSEDLGRFGPTAASLAWNAFRHRFMRHKLVAPKDPEVVDRARLSYYGGRVEVFKWGRHEGRFYQLDVNSMHPAVMRDSLFPAFYVETLKDVGPRALRSVVKNDLVVGRCLLNARREAYPKRLEGAGLVFPVGRFWTNLTTPELRLALEHGDLEYCDVVDVYHGERIFRDYVDYFYGKRLEAKREGKAAYELFYKLVLNSLYGKFGQRDRVLYSIGWSERERYFTSEFYDYTGQRLGVLYFVGNSIVHKSTEEREAPMAFTAVAAHVSAYGRAALWTLIEAAGIENVFYTDTDSVIVNEVGFTRLRDLIGEGLGALKVEKEADVVEIRTLKDYRIGDKERVKGINKSCREVGENTYLCLKWYRVLSSLRYALDGGVLQERTLKVLSRDLKKRVPREDGSTEALVLNEE